MPLPDIEEGHSQNILMDGEIQLLNTTTKRNGSISFQGIRVEHDTCIIEESGLDLVHMEEETDIKENKAYLVIRISQRDEKGKILRVAAKGKKSVENNEQYFQ